MFLPIFTRTIVKLVRYTSNNWRLNQFPADPSPFDLFQPFRRRRHACHGYIRPPRLGLRRSLLPL